MTERVIFGALVGATIGFGIGLLGSRTGGTCPILCNPYVAAGFGMLLGGLFTSSGAGPVRDFTPSPHLVEIESEQQFQELVLEGEKPVLVEFGRPGCHFCRKLEPTMHELADRFAGRVAVAKVNTRDLSTLARRYEISAVPALFLFQNGEPVEQMVGYREKDVLVSLLDQHAPAPAPEPTAESGSPA
jgi:thioredoxin 1